MKALVLLFLMLLLSGCNAASAPADTAPPTPTPAPTPVVLTVSVGSEGSTIDPTYLTEPDPADVLSHLFEGLVKYAPEETTDTVNAAQPVLGLAETMEVSADGLTYRFTIRADARWSDGVPVTAEDFVYAWRRLLTPSGDGETAHAAGAAQLYDVLLNARAVAEGAMSSDALGVTAESERVLTVRLEKVCPWFPKLCAMPCMVPLRRDIIEQYGGDWTNERNIVVSGAYTISAWVHDDYMHLVRNPYYYDEASLGPHEILWRFGGEGCDFAAAVSDAEATGTVSVAGTYYLYLNANAIRDWRVRAAMLLSVDREALTEALGGGAMPAWGLVPEGISMTDGEAYVPEATSMYTWLQGQYPDYDLTAYEGRCALAKLLMQQARAAGSWYGSYTLYYRFNASTVNRTVAERCASDWQRELGLRCELVSMDVADYAARLESNTFDVAYLSWLPDYDDPLSFLRIMERGGAHNHSGWGDVRYNEQLRLAAENADSAARDALLRRAEEMLYEEERFAVCPLYWFGESYYAGDGVSGVGYNAVNGYNFCYARVE